MIQQMSVVPGKDTQMYVEPWKWGRWRVS